MGVHSRGDLERQSTRVVPPPPIVRRRPARDGHSTGCNLVRPGNALTTRKTRRSLRRRIHPRCSQPRRRLPAAGDANSRHTRSRALDRPPSGGHLVHTLRIASRSAHPPRFTPSTTVAAVRLDSQVGSASTGPDDEIAQRLERRVWHRVDADGSTASVTSPTPNHQRAPPTPVPWPQSRLSRIRRLNQLRARPRVPPTTPNGAPKRGAPPNPRSCRPHPPRRRRSANHPRWGPDPPTHRRP